MKRKSAANVARDQAELVALAERVRGTLRRSAEDILAIGADLNRAKEMLGHGNFGTWLDHEFGLSRRSAEQFMAAARRFGARSEAVSHLPAGAMLELSAPSVPDELVERVLSGQMPASISTIRQEKGRQAADDRSAKTGGRFVDYLDGMDGSSLEVAAGIAAHVLKRWDERGDREWFETCMQLTAELLAEHLDDRVGLLDRERTIVRRLIGDADAD